MNMLVILGYVAICIAAFTVLRIPLNRWTVPTASIGGAVLIFTLVQFLNYYHPYSDTSREYLTSTPSDTDQVTAVPMKGDGHNLVAWFSQNSRARLNDGSTAEVTFDSIPGQVFSGKVQMVLTTADEDSAWARDKLFDPPATVSQSRIPVLINITDPDYEKYLSRISSGSHAQAAIYGEQFYHLGLVRKTLLRMSAWTNYLSPFS